MLRNKISRLFSGFQTSQMIKYTAVTSAAVLYSLARPVFQASSTKKTEEEYDLAVIGGGSGGLATALKAQEHGLKVVVIDFVEESPQHTKWGLGGTCVNVGCIPKKLMHQAAKIGDDIINGNDYGWVLPNGANERENEEEFKKMTFKWDKLREAVTLYIRSINWGYVANINRDDNIEYINALATFKDKNTIICSKDPSSIREYVRNGTIPKQVEEVKAKMFVIATGTRPTYLSFEGAHEAITSDDIFWRKSPPGKTLVVGGGYVAVEIAGFLRGMGFNTSLMTRGQYLRAFDRDMVKEVINDLKRRKLNIIPTSLPSKIRRVGEKELEVTIKNQQTKEETTETFETVLMAVGRHATTQLLNLEKIGVKIDKRTKKIVTAKEEVERTSVDNIYALGDVVQGLPELTSTAVKMGHYLANRLAHRQGKKQFPDSKMSISLQNYPTTLFTPLEYSCSGMSEENAIEHYGKDKITVYHVKYSATEQNILDKYNDDGTDDKVKVYAKAVVHNDTDKVVGLHYSGPNAGEVMQGFAVAMRIGMTKYQLDTTIGIHPTSAEELTNMTGRKGYNEKYEKTSC